MNDIEKKRKQLIFRSWHRGTREMDLILGPFADKHVNSFSDAELQSFEALLECSDPDLYDWITGKASPSLKDNVILQKIIILSSRA